MAEVIVRSRGGLTQDVQIGSHALVADEPVEAGGADLGPDPYELLLAALGTCTAMTLRLYADAATVALGQRRGATAPRARARSRLQDCDTQDRVIDRITKEMTLHGDLDAAQRQRLLEIAERCPVQRTLQRGIVIEQRSRRVSRAAPAMLTAQTLYSGMPFGSYTLLVRKFAAVPCRLTNGMKSSPRLTSGLTRAWQTIEPRRDVTRTGCRLARRKCRRRSGLIVAVRPRGPCRPAHRHGWSSCHHASGTARGRYSTRSGSRRRAAPSRLYPGALA